MNCITSRIDFIDKQKQTDNTYKFVLIYQNLNTQFCMLKPLTSIHSKEVAHVLIDIFSTLGAPRILKCEGDTIFANELANNLHNHFTNIIIICESMKIYGFKYHTEEIKRVINEMLDTWMTINKTNKWVEGLDIVQFQKNHNIYYEAIHVPNNCNKVLYLNSEQGVTALKSIREFLCNMNIQEKNKKMASGIREENILECLQKKTNVDEKTETNLSLIVVIKQINIDHEEDNDKYEIIEEILNTLVNPISSHMEIHDKELPQLLQKPAKECLITDILQEHDTFSEFNTASEEELQKQEKLSESTTGDKEEVPKIERKLAEECSNLEALLSNEKYSESNIADKEDFPQLVQKTAQECSKLEGQQNNEKCSEANTTDKEELPRLEPQAIQDQENREDMQGNKKCSVSNTADKLCT